MQDNADYSGCPRDSDSPPRRDTMTRKLGSCGRSGRGNPFVKSADLISDSPLVSRRAGYFWLLLRISSLGMRAARATRGYNVARQVSHTHVRFSSLRPGRFFPRHHRATARSKWQNSVCALRSFGLNASVGPFSRTLLRTRPIVSGHMRGTIQPVCRFSRVFEPVTITFLGMRAEKVI